jgi:hypothetical protein
MARPYARRMAQRQIFLRALGCGVSVTEAGAQSRLAISTLYHWRQHDAKFRDAWDEAADAGAAFMAMSQDDAMMRRAVEPVERPVSRRGEVVGVRQRYSDSALMFAIRELRARQEMRQPAAAEQVAEEPRVRVIIAPARGNEKR